MFRLPLAGMFAALLLVPTSSAFAQADAPVEYKLAVIQSGGYVAPSDRLVSQIGAELDALGTKCIEPRIRLSDFAVVVHNQMAQRGIDESHLSILQHVDASIPDDLGGPTPCADVFAAYFTLRVDQ